VQTIIFQPGEKTRTITIPVCADVDGTEGTEAIGLTLLNPQNVALGPRSVAIVAIADCPPRQGRTAAVISGRSAANSTLVTAQGAPSNHATDAVDEVLQRWWDGEHRKPFIRRPVRSRG